MRPITDAVSSQAAGTTLPMDWRNADFKVALAVVLSGGANLTYSVEHTLDDIQDATVTPTWFTNDGLSALTASADGNIAFPVTATRLNVTAFTGGTATLTVIQGG
jgi:hypothetical protein